MATDLSRRMIDVASERARAEGLDHLEFAQCAGEDLQFHDESFDGVMNGYGLMFSPDPTRALAEAHRVLAPEGQIALSTWDLPAASPFFSLFLDAAAEFFVLREPGPDEPHPFRLASVEALRSMLRQAGFQAIRVDHLTMTFECDSALAYGQIFTDYGWKSRIDALPSDQQARFRRAIAKATRPYEVGGRLRLAATSLCASAQKESRR